MSKFAKNILNKALGFKREPAVDWRQCTMALPPIRPFIHHCIEQSNKSHYERHLYTQKTPASEQQIDLRKPYRILSLDGGGVRGILTTTILERISEHNPNFMNEIDFIVGTSAGGILALLLASGYSPKECTDIYKWGMPHIFGHDPLRVMNPFQAKYCDKAKEEIMQKFFGNRTMSDLEKTCAVVAFRLDGKKSRTHSFFNKDGWRPAVFSNMSRASGLVSVKLHYQYVFKM